MVALAFRLLTTLPVFLPAVLGMGMPAVYVAMAMLIAGNLIFSIFNTGFFIFFMDSLPKEGRVSYIYLRMMLLRIAYTVFMLGMGFLLDAMHRSYAGFVAVFCTGLALGLADVYVITRIRGAEGPGSEAGGASIPLRLPGLARRLLSPLKNRRFARYLAFTFAFFFFSAMATAYTSLYQYKYLNLSVGFITAYNASIYVIMIAVTRLWARVEARAGSLRVLVACAALMCMDYVVYGFLTQKSLWVIVFSPIFMGLGSSGFWACALPYRYDLMPEEGKMVYEGWNGFCFGLAGLLGALAGSALQRLLPAVSTPFMRFSVFQLVYLLAGALTLLSTYVFWRRARKDAGPMS
jgi:hypothetical protein